MNKSCTNLSCPRTASHFATTIRGWSLPRLGLLHTSVIPDRRSQQVLAIHVPKVPVLHVGFVEIGCLLTPPSPGPETKDEKAIPWKEYMTMVPRHHGYVILARRLRSILI